MNKKLLLMVALFGLSTAANAASMKDLTLQALSEGSAKGEMDIQMQSVVSAQTKSSEPVYVEVSTIKRFAQQGCARLQYVISQDKVLHKTGELGPFQTSWQLNICQDGSPPSGE